jgi:hypothetical protein
LAGTLVRQRPKGVNLGKVIDISGASVILFRAKEVSECKHDEGKNTLGNASQKEELPGFYHKEYRLAT